MVAVQFAGETGDGCGIDAPGPTTNTHPLDVVNVKYLLILMGDRHQQHGLGQVQALADQGVPGGADDTGTRGEVG